MADHPVFQEDHGFFSDFLCGGAKRMLMGNASSPDEVDFERNPTGLYIAVHTKNWALALDRAGSYPREAGIWVLRLEDTKSSNDVDMSSPRAKTIPPSGQRVVRWRMLPLHAAILFGAPVPVIKAIIKANPNACGSPDDQGMTPLHLAFRAGSSEEVAVTLLEACPEAIEMVDYKGRLPSMLVPKHTMSYADTIAEALIRGPSQYYWSARVSSADRVKTQIEMAARIKQLEEANQHQIRMSQRLLNESQHHLTEEIEALSIENVQLKERTAFYEAKYDGAEEKERVLVDHTNSLAERLRLTSLSEEHLATKLAKLEANLKGKESELKQLQTKSQEEKTAMQKQMQNMATDLAKVEQKANQLTLSLAKKNDECVQMEKQFQKERELFEKQVESSKECFMELIASSKEDKKTFEQDSKELRQQLMTLQAELQKANQKVEHQANEHTATLAKKNDECVQMEKRFQKERKLFEKQVEASKKCLLELIASSKEDKMTFEQDSKELRQQLMTLQAELQKANQAPIDLERQLEKRLMDIELKAQSANKEQQRISNAQSANKEQQRDQRQRDHSPPVLAVPSQRQQAQTPTSPRTYTNERQQAEKSVTPRKYAHKKELSLGVGDFDEYIAESYQVQSRDDDDVVSIDSDIDTAALGDLSPEQQEALLNLDLSGSTAEVAKALKKVPGLTENQVTLLLQVASSLAA
jgi:hypothetical protein